jgi:hypothetical protein
MKYFMLISLFVLTLFNNIKAQSPLTIREAFNFAVGDTFVYRDSIYINTSYAKITNNIVGITITAKWTDLNTLFYQRKVTTMVKEKYQSWTGHPGSFYPPSSFVFTDTTTTKFDTLVVNNLDSIVTYKIPVCSNPSFQGWGPCLKGDSTFIIPNSFNQRLITQGFIGVGGERSRIIGDVYSSNVFYFQRYGSGLGPVINEDFNYISGGYFYNTRELLQYTKGNETWQKTYLSNLNPSKDFSSLALDIQLSPNPTNGFLSIKSNESFDHIRVMGISGFVFFEKPNIMTNEEAIHLNHIPNGFYFVQTFKEGRLMGVGKCLVNN